MADTSRDIRISVRTTRDEGPRKSSERVDELGDHASKTTARLALMSKAGDRTSKSLLKMAGAATAANVAMTGLGNSTKRFDFVMFRVHRAIVSLGGALVKSLVGGLKLATLALGGMSIALVGIHAAFVAGKFLMKAYNVGLQALAATAAGTSVAIGLVATAIREQQAATYAYLGRGHKEFGNGLNQTRMMMRGLQMDTQLAGVGVEALNKAFAEIAKGQAGYTSQSKTLLKGLMDFAAAGQPLEEGVQKAAQLVAVLQDSKKGFGAIQEAAKALGPAMEEAMKKAAKQGIDTREELMAALTSGQLSTLGGVQGQFDAVNNTLIGQLKKYFNLIRGQFADFGQQFLPQAKFALQRIYEIFTRTMQMTSGAVAGWEKRGGFVDALVNATQKVADFYVKLIRDYLPKSEGMFRRLGDWWRNFKSGWREIVDGLRPLVDGARVIEKSFGNAWRPVWKEIKSNTKEFGDTLQNNRSVFEQFGTSLGNTVAKLLEVIRIFQRIITQNMPFISRVLDGITELFSTLGSMFSTLENLPFFSNREAFITLMGLGRGMKTNRGSLVERTQQMNVQANNVSIMGGIKGAMYGAQAGRIGGPKGMAAGGVAGALAGSGLLGQKAQNFVNASGGSAAGQLGIRNIAKSMFGRGPGAAQATPAAATQASDSTLQSTRATSGLSKSTNTATKSLNLFSRSLGGATRALRSGGAIAGGGQVPIAGNSQERAQNATAGRIPRLTGFVGQQFQGHLVPTGQKQNIPVGRIGALRRSFGGMMGASNAYKAQRDAERKGVFGGGMGAIGTSLLLSAVSDRIQNKEIAGGLSLAASAAMFNPKLGAGIAGGTFALRSGNAGLATLGGAGAGAAVGSAFGPIGTLIGAGIGTITGAIMAPINAMRAATAKAKTIIDGFFARTVGEMMVNVALLENAQVLSGRRETTIGRTMRNQAGRYRDLAGIAGRGAAGGGRRARANFAQQVGGGVGAGALAGTVIGGTAGTAAAGAGAIPGAIAGAVTGAVVGGLAGLGTYVVNKIGDAAFSGRRNARTRRERVGAIRELYGAGAIGAEDMRSLTRDGGKTDIEQQKFLEDFQKRIEALAEASEEAGNLVESRAKLISDMTGMAQTEAVRLAQTMGVNLADNTADFRKQLEELGITVVKTSQQLDQAIAQIVANGMSVFDTAIKQQEAPQILDEVMKNFRMDFNQRTVKEITAADAKLLYGTAFEQMTNMYSGDTSKAYFELARQMGSAGGMAFNERNAQGKLNPLGGLGNMMFSGMTGQAIKELMTTSEKGVADLMAGQLAAVLAQGGTRLEAGGMDKVKNAFMNMSIDEQQRFFDTVSSGNLGGTGQSFLQSAGINVSTQGIDEATAAFYIAKDNAEKEAVLLEAQRQVIEDMGKFFSPDADRPEWWTKEALTEVFKAAGIGGDTSSPRGSRIGDTTSSRLSQTLSRHQAMNSMVSGKRMITSSYRTGNLGSINSDHITGRAYDIVGNQLGMYKTIVEKNGGFAEFHGGSINRHLHVVPGNGVSAPMGDTVTPASRSMSPSSGQSSGTKNTSVTINLEVNGIGIKEAIPQIKSELERAMYEMQNRS
jgi:hypothetical protein